MSDPDPRAAMPPLRYIADEPLTHLPDCQKELHYSSETGLITCLRCGAKVRGHVEVQTKLERFPLVAQHTWTPACDGFHKPGPCP